MAPSISVWQIWRNWSYLTDTSRYLLSSFLLAKLVPHWASFPPLPPNALPILGRENIPECQDGSSPTRQGSEPSCYFIEPKGSLHCLRYIKWAQKDKWRANTTQICTCKNSPVTTAAHELGGSSNRWLRLSNFPIPEVVPFCFPSISFLGTQLWQAVGPLESTVFFKVIPEWYSNRGQPTCYPESET